MATAFQINRPPTAFSTSPVKGKRRPRITDEQHLKWIRTLPCLITGARPVDPAHIRFAAPAYGKRETGGGEKSSDRWVVPLCRDKHDEQHKMDERAFWARYAIDPCRVALALWSATGDDDLAEVILNEARTLAL